MESLFGGRFFHRKPVTRKAHHLPRTAPKYTDKTLVGLAYANWCGHCTAMKPEWDKMKDGIRNHPAHKDKIEIMEVEDGEPGKDAKFANMNAKLHPGKKLEVRGFPYLFRIVGGTAHEYKGKRDAPSMMAWAVSPPQQKNAQYQYGGKKKTRNRRRKLSTAKSTRTPSLKRKN